MKTYIEIDRGKQKWPLFPPHKTSFSVFEFRARLTSLFSRCQLISNYANER